MKKLFFIIFLISVLLISCSKPATVIKTNGQQQPLETAAQPVQPTASTEEARTELAKTITGRTKTYKISYDVSAKSPEKQFDEMTISLKNENTRIDTSATNNGQQIKSSIFILGDKSYICTEFPQKMCLTSDVKQAKQSTFTGAETVENDLKNLSIQALPSKTIIGINAQCYRITGTEAEDICYSKEGILLYIKTINSEMTAKSLTTNVPDSTFELPAQPQSMSAYNVGVVPS